MTLLPAGSSNIQDGSVLHTDLGRPLTIAEGVTVGHKVMLHGCFIGEIVDRINSIVSMEQGSVKIVLLERISIPEGKEILDGSLAMDRHKVIRQLRLHGSIAFLRLSFRELHRQIQKRFRRRRQDYWVICWGLAIESTSGYSSLATLKA